MTVICDRLKSPIEFTWDQKWGRYLTQKFCKSCKVRQNKHETKFASLSALLPRGSGGKLDVKSGQWDNLRQGKIIIGGDRRSD